MAKKPKYQSKPTFHFQPANMIQGDAIGTNELLQYLKAAVQSDGQLEEAVTSLIDALKERTK